jgi:hypothetical protein
MDYSMIREIEFPDTSLLIPCSDLSRTRCFLQQNVQLREGRVHFREQNSENSLYFSLLAGNLGGERLAPDCVLRHAVWAAENSYLYFPQNARDMPVFRDYSQTNRTAEKGRLSSGSGFGPSFSL